MQRHDIPTSVLPDWINVSRNAKELFSLMAGAPLVSGTVLSEMRRKASTYAFPYLKELREAGLVASDELGANSDKAASNYISGQGRQYLRYEDRCWHEDGGRALLLHRFPVAEALPKAASWLNTEKLGGLTRFHYYRDAAWDAAADYQNGFALLFWIGLLQRESDIKRRFLRLGPDLLEHAAPGPRPWPAVLYFVVHDRWQEEIVKRAARPFGFEDQIQFLSVRDYSITAATNPRDSRGGIVPEIITAFTGNWSWEDRVRSSLWSSPQAQRNYRLLTLATEFPRMWLDFARAAFDEKPESRYTQEALRVLRTGNKAYLDARPEDGDLRYSVSKLGYHREAMVDGVNTSSIPGGVRGPVGTGGSPAHDDGAMMLMAEFLREGLLVAAGWRSRERWRGGGIEPDGMVFLTSYLSPFGPSWHYIEYELSARYAARALKKFLRYLHTRRQDDFPLLLVAWNANAERHFQEIGRHNNGRDGFAKLITTTVERLARHGALGNDRCWSWYGAPVQLG